MNAEPTSETPMNSSKRILIVDDDFAWAEILKSRLEEVPNYEVRIESDSRRAVETGRKFRPHCVLLDIIMPNPDGNDVATRYHLDPELRHIPIAFLSGMLTKREADARGYNQDGETFFTKPVNIYELIKFIDGQSGTTNDLAA